MAVTPLYEFEDLLYDTQGWNGITHSNFQKVEAYLHTLFIGDLGENVSAYEAVYVKSDGDIWKAQANGTDQPCVGIMIEAGTAAEAKRFQTRGLITNAGWSWTVGANNPIYLDPSTPGALTQTEPSSNAQILGFPTASDTIFLMPIIPGVATPFVPIAGFQTGVLTSSEILDRRPFSSDTTFPSGLGNSHMVATAGAAAATTITLYKNGVSFATADFKAGLTINAAAAVDKGGGLVGIPVTSHGLTTGEKIQINGTTNYDGDYTVDATSTTNEIVITATYAAETFGGTETVDMLWAALTCASDASFTAGVDVFTMSGPSSADSTLAGLAWSFAVS